MVVENTVKDLKDYFGTPERVVSSKEMMDFWRNCSEEEKDYFRKAELS